MTRLDAATDATTDRRRTRACTGAQTPVGQMFPGTCTASATLDALADCAGGVARGQFFASLATTDALTIDCDLQDNGATDLSCESPELREHVLDRLGYGGDAWSRARIQTLGVRDYIDEQLSPETIDDKAFHDDLGTDLGRTLTLVGTEFGRRVDENGGDGTDHGHGGVMMAMGAGIAGNRVILKDGAWPGLAPANRFIGQDLQVTTDFRDVYAEALNRHLGLATSQMGSIFPSFSVSTSRFPGLFA